MSTLVLLFSFIIFFFRAMMLLTIIPSRPIERHRVVVRLIRAAVAIDRSPGFLPLVSIPLITRIIARVSTFNLGRERSRYRGFLFRFCASIKWHFGVMVFNTNVSNLMRPAHKSGCTFLATCWLHFTPVSFHLIVIELSSLPLLH